MKIVKLILLIFVLCSTGCNPQNKKNMNIIIYKEKFRNLHLEVKKGIEPPVCVYRFNYSNVYIEMYINDKLFFKSYVYSHEIENYQLINHYLNKGVKQKLKLILKPIDDDVFNNQSFFTVMLSSFEKKSNYDNWSNEQKIMRFSTNEFPRDSTGVISGGYIKEKKLEGKTYFEKEFEFEAGTPFKLPNSQEMSEDLQQLDTVVLKKQLIAYFERFRNSILNTNDADFFWETNYKKVYLECMANYRTAEEIQAYYNSALLTFTEQRLSILPFKDYEMVFYDNGRLVTLESTSLNYKKRGKSILNFVFKQEGKDIQESNKMQFYFHIPKGSNSLEVIY